MPKPNAMTDALAQIAALSSAIQSLRSDIAGMRSDLEAMARCVERIEDRLADVDGTCVRAGLPRESAVRSPFAQ